MVVGLVGPLGAGKTEWVKGLAEGLGIEAKWVASPTFVIASEYPGARPLAHVDFYRLESEGELEAAGFLDLLDPGRVVAIEWADRFPGALPGDRIEVRIARGAEQPETERAIEAVAWGPIARSRPGALRTRDAKSGGSSAVALIVQKYGGTSVADVERIRHVAKRVVASVSQGHRVAVVVSAMSGETDALVALARDAGGEDPDPREYDALVSTGEQKTIALLAMAIHRLGHKARSFTGAQMGMRTDASHTRARIQSIDRARIDEVLDAGAVAVIAGFQGTDDAGNITTLGRGGSDTSAVAVAAALEADVCEIFTDVSGVFTTDPNLVPAARKLDRISFDEMLEMASLGAKVLQIRSVKLAQQYGVPLHVRSTFEEVEGTWVTREEDVMERLVVSGVTYQRNEAKIRVAGLKDQPGVSARLFTPISDAGIVVDMIVQNAGHDGSTDITFTVPRGDFKRALEMAGQHRSRDRRSQRRGRRQDREGLDRRARDEGSRRGRIEDVPHAGGGRRQHPDDRNQRDQDLGHDRGEIHGTRGACAPRGLRRERRRRAEGGVSPDRARAALVVAGLALAIAAAQRSRRATPKRVESPSRRAAGCTHGRFLFGRGAPLEGAARLAFGLPLDLNRADARALEALPGIGVGRAAAIVAARSEAPFCSVRELERVAGIGRTTVARLADRVVAHCAPAERGT